MLLRAVGAVLSCSLLAGCAFTPFPAPEFLPREVRATLGPDRVGLLVPAYPNGRLIIAGHGHGGDVEEWLTGRDQAAIRDALLGAGYSLATSDAGGNVWGAPVSVKAYEDLYTWAAHETRVQEVILLGQSMGALPTLQVIGKVPATRFVGVYPVCDLATMTDKFPTFRQAWPDGAPADLAPVKPKYPPGFRAIFFASPYDTTVPKASNTDVCAAGARAAGADATVVQVQGEHGDPTAFQPDRVLEFLRDATQGRAGPAGPALPQLTGFITGPFGLPAYRAVANTRPR